MSVMKVIQLLTKKMQAGPDSEIECRELGGEDSYEELTPWSFATTPFTQRTIKPIFDFERISHDMANISLYMFFCLLQRKSWRINEY